MRRVPRGVSGFLCQEGRGSRSDRSGPHRDRYTESVRKFEEVGPDFLETVRRRTGTGDRREVYQPERGGLDNQDPTVTGESSVGN